MFLRFSRRAVRHIVGLGVVALLLGYSSGCGRTPIPEGDGTFESPCRDTRDCDNSDRCQSKSCIDGFCQVVSVTTCDDDDACTEDRCVPRTGNCEYVPRTSDEDGDGHRAPLLGMAPGAAGACGDDCDDTSSNAVPNGVETCDGVDNDCNGVIDDTRSFGSPTEPVLVSNATKNESIPASITYADGGFALTTIQRDERWHGYFQTVDSFGNTLIQPEPLTLDTSDGMAGPVVFTGAVYGTAWEDRRDQSYDIYFNRLDPTGTKMGPDIRVTDNPGFSVSPSLIWDGQHWVIAYSDETENASFRVYARRLDYEGTLLGEPVVLSDRFTDARAPRLMRTPEGLSVFFTAVGDGLRYVRLDDSLNPKGEAKSVALDEAGEISVRWNQDRFVVAWSKKHGAVGNEIWAITLDSAGNVLDEARPIAVAPTMARSPAWVALGDRAYLVWADDYFSPGTYELSGQMFSSDLSPMGERAQLTRLGADTFDPTATIGGPHVGVLFRSRNLGEWQSYFLSLRCLDLGLR